MTERGRTVVTERECQFASNTKSDGCRHVKLFFEAIDIQTLFPQFEI